MVTKANKTAATLHATERLDKVIKSHRAYFSDWRSTKFEQPNESSYKSDSSLHQLDDDKRREKPQ